jgi:hypothetical protein
MNIIHLVESKRKVVAATSTVAFTVLLTMATPFAYATSNIVAAHSDQPATSHCDTTITGYHKGVINVAAPKTYCLVHLLEIGAVNVAPGAALSVTSGSVINGAITLLAPKAFSFCGSSTVGGALKASRSAGFILIGSGGDSGALATPCRANTIDGAVTLNGNLGGVEVGGNFIAGALTVSGNVGPHNGSPNENSATEVEGNSVRGLTTCATNKPAAINDGHKNTFTGGAKGQCLKL